MPSAARAALFASLGAAVCRAARIVGLEEHRAVHQPWEKQYCIQVGTVHDPKTMRLVYPDEDKCRELLQAAKAACVTYDATPEKKKAFSQERATCLAYQGAQAKIQEEQQRSEIPTREDAPVDDRLTEDIQALAEAVEAGRGGADGSLSWARKYCIEVGTVANRPPSHEDCQARLEAARLDCQSMAEAGVRQRVYSFTTCKEFGHIRRAILEEKPVSREIEAAVRACEPAVAEVCETTLCPTWCKFGEKRSDCDCHARCASSTLNAFNMGSFACPKGQPWMECLATFRQTLQTRDHRNTALEALLREHALKCICVSRTRDNFFCYEGGAGIGFDEQGEKKKWCQYDKTSEWAPLKAQDGYAEFFQPECEAFPHKPPEE